MNVNRYNFDSIVGKTKKNILPIRRDEADRVYAKYLAVLETTLFSCHEKYHFNGIKAREILQMVLFDAKSAAEGVEYDCSAWAEDYSRECADRIGGLFLPEKNEQLRAALKEGTAVNDDYLEFPRKLLVRVCESIDRWTKSGGSNGYFDFVSDYILPENALVKEFLVEDRFLVSE